MLLSPCSATGVLGVSDMQAAACIFDGQAAHWEQKMLYVTVYDALAGWHIKTPTQSMEATPGGESAMVIEG